MSARIVQLSISKGGVPKLPVDEVHIGELGLAGDQHRDLKHHGGVERAVCLYSADVIAVLQAEGHLMTPGSLGENVTIAGLDWAALQPGQRYQLGDSVVLELTRDTTPCRTIMNQFADKKFSRIAHRHHPGWSRWYARVISEGTVRAGDPVALSD